MAQCVYCKSDTEMYDSGAPVCLDCANRAEANPPAEQNIRDVLQQELRAATARAHAATDAFNAIMGDIPSALPHPDGTQRIHNIYRELSIARREMMEAHTRLGDYLTNGTIPANVDQSGES